MPKVKKIQNISNQDVTVPLVGESCLKLAPGSTIKNIDVAQVPTSCYAEYDLQEVNENKESNRQKLYD